MAPVSPAAARTAASPPRFPCSTLFAIPGLSASEDAPVKSRLLLSLLLLLPATCLAAGVPSDDLFDIKPIADGVYAAIAKPAYKLNCNAAIILLGDSVLVVDTHSKPSAARALIQQIKNPTPKPVKSVVNQHFHTDHSHVNEP